LSETGLSWATTILPTEKGMPQHTQSPAGACGTASFIRGESPAPGSLSKVRLPFRLTVEKRGDLGPSTLAGICVILR